MTLKIYSDGASRGNPGPSAIAYMILMLEGDYLLKEHSEYIGMQTNNQAEYEALIAALESATDFGNMAVCYLDSELVVKQINGEIRIVDSKLRTLWRKVTGIKQRFKKVAFTHVSRTNICIQRVDQLANQALDEAVETMPKPIVQDEMAHQLHLSSFSQEEEDKKR